VKITLLGVLLDENHKSTPKIVKKLEIININKSYGDLKREQSDHRNWKAAAIGIVKSNLYVSSETVKCDLKGHESLTWKSSGWKRFFSSLLGLWCGGFEGEKWRQLEIFYLFKLSDFSLLFLSPSPLFQNLDSERCRSSSKSFNFLTLNSVKKPKLKKKKFVVKFFFS